MEDTTVKATPIDLDDLFGGETAVKLQMKGCDVRFRFRELDARTDIEFQRRSAKMGNRNGKPEPTVESLSADCWLFDQLCTAVEVSAKESAPVAVADFKDRLAPDVKRNALFYYRQRVAKADEAGN